MRAQASGCGSQGTPNAAAMHSLVMSSCVGPMPPVVNTWSKAARTSLTVRTMTAGDVGDDAHLAQRHADLAQAGGEELMLASWVRPERTSLPMTSRAAVGFSVTCLSCCRDRRARPTAEGL